MATYIRDDIYDTIVEAVSTLGLDPNDVKVALGEVGDCWPTRIIPLVAAGAYADLELKRKRRGGS